LIFRPLLLILMAGLLGLFIGCASPGAMPPTQRAPGLVSDVARSPRGANPEAVAPVIDPADREAIRRLAGQFRVEMTYEEIEAMREGYALRPTVQTSAREAVRIVEQASDRVVLEHLLLVGDGPLVVKHWREDWVYAPERAVQYVDRRTWRWASYPAAGEPGVWVRTIFEADGAPVYSGWGRWEHGSGGSEWTSQGRVLAPLPRRESARAGEYEVAWIADRVRVDEGGGWTQWQQLTKADFVPTRPPLALESGRIDYVPIADDAIGIAVEAYWNRVGPYWAEARVAWRQLWESREEVTLDAAAGEVPRWRRLFQRVNAAAAAGDPPASIRPDLARVLRESVARP
jgi:hypothetical protein